MGRGPAAKRPAASASSSSNRTLRGLIVNHKYASRFVTDGKTWEIKHTFARCVKEGQVFFLVESGIGHNQFGVAVFRILAKLQFTGQQHVSWSDLKSKHKSQHCCTAEELDSLRKSWKNQSAPPAAWDVRVVEVLSVPMYTRSSGQDMTWTCTWT